MAGDVDKKLVRRKQERFEQHGKLGDEFEAHPLSE
jgi:hypothetical protein